MKRPVVFGPAATALFRLDRPTAVSAGAGSGKTTALVELCVRLLSGEATGAPCDPSALAAITFTERAGEELVERLRGAVAARAGDASPADPGPSGARSWHDRLQALEGMAVGTIHGFCGRLLRERAPEAGLDPEFSVVDEERAAAWLAEASRAAVVAALDEGLPAARALAAGLGAAVARGGLASVVAGMVRERATRGDRGPIALAGPDERAAREARARLSACAAALERLSPTAGSGGRALAAEMRRAWEPLAGVREGSGPVEARALVLLAGLASVGKGKRLARAEEGLREVRDALREAAREVALLEAERLAGPQREALARLVEETEGRYAATKREARAVDFDDLLLLARDLLRADPALRAELRAGLRALLVDEYQDVNGLQQEIFEMLSGPGEPGGPLLVAVGDLKQSIYRFRGADVSVFARLVGGMEREGGRVLRLAENHRSAPAILDLVNETFARALPTERGEAHPEDELAFDEADRLVPTRPGGAHPACEILVEEGEGKGSSAERRAREAEAIARRVGAIVSGAAGIAVRDRGEDGAERPRRPRLGDVALLFRRLTQIGPYERALRAAGLPYRLARGGGFYQAPEVRDLGELLATLFDPGDALAWAALLRSPLCLVSDATLLRLSRRGLPRLGRLSPVSLRADLEAGGGLPDDEWARLSRFLAVRDELRALRDRLALPDLLARAVDGLDLEAALLAGPDGERKAVNLAKAIALAGRFEEGGGRAGDFPRHLRALAARPPREPEAELESGDAVAVLSVHQAKGLEWPVVFVPDLGARPRSDARRALLDRQGRLCAAFFDPSFETFHETASLRAAREAERQAARAESRRLLYVAMTRARDHLVLSGESSSGVDSWRGMVEQAAGARPELLRRIPYAEAAAAALGPALPAGEAKVEPGADPLVPPRLAEPAPVAAIRAAVTDLVEYARCPRRHHLGRFLGIPEPRAVARPAADDPARATARGTLAHAMLSEADLGAPPLERRAQMSAAASRRGYDPASAGVRRILGEIARFLDSAEGRPLVQAAREGRLSREVPFLLRLPWREGSAPLAPPEGREGPAVHLSGAIDALVRGRRGEGLTVVDYKYATPRPEAAGRYRLQLLAYALAARRAHPGAPVRARLQFLRGDLRALDVTPSERDLAAFAREAPALAWDAYRGAGDRTASELGREEARCRAEGCGYVGRCHPLRRTLAAMAGDGPVPANPPFSPLPPPAPCP